LDLFFMSTTWWREDVRFDATIGGLRQVCQVTPYK
jgi:hypothetical protein